MLSRRLFIAGGLATISAPLPLRAQPAGRMAKIGVLWHAANEQEESPYIAVIRRGLRDLGYVEGKNILLENRYPSEQPERFNSLAIELAQLKVDVLVAVTVNAALATQRATSSTPIVFLLVPEPVRLKLVASLARPGGNITGLSQIAEDLTGKRLDLLKETIPAMSRVGLLADANMVSTVRSIELAKHAADILKLRPLPHEARSPDAIERAFAGMAQGGAHGVLVLPSGMFHIERKRIGALALKHRLPTISWLRESVESGGLMSYGASNSAIFYRAAYYIDRILKGTKPADLPVEQPTRFELVINGKTATAMGLKIPETVLLRADEVI